MRDSYSLSHYICPADMGMIDFLDMSVKAGFRAVALSERAMIEVPPKQLKKELAARELTITSINSAGYFLSTDPAIALRQKERNDWFVDCAQELNASPLNVIVGGIGPAQGTMSLEAGREKSLEDLLAIAEKTKAAGVPILFEPIHPMGMWMKGCVHSLAQSLEMIQRIPDATINLDIYHSWWDSDLTSFLEDSNSRLGLIQICDVAPFGDEFVPRRAPLGEGIVDIKRIVELAWKRSAPVPLEVELFAFQIADRNFSEVIAQTVSYIERLEASRA